ncbi:class I SAM-dependent methyltransferase [Roseomonas sp. PWR1]|uniref:Class I SAM-dependent methyltransferase n=1 Tax=Roseomonas nitratireducens TaxID=2820810 RepID=A0ABS4AZT3_9PROT|nr:class I SAM-dependent methyltransferase [Neoroseomonas nitratireducens]MBP0466754.1 class I SAM-dependent methyltransferase [Neoroseomonas nitratireducens]
MTDAKSRYGAADVRYVAAFQPECGPARLRLALAMADTWWNPPDPDRLTVLDIGCGRGVSVCLLAAANPGWDVIGLDLQPVHIAEARDVARQGGLDNARFIEADLAELTEANSADLLPEIDIIICHGVWTWVPDPVREGIVRMLKSRLKPGGLMLMGYNALPGYADTLHFQRMIDEAARAMHGDEASRGIAAIEAISALAEHAPLYMPEKGILERITKSARNAPPYLVHEWLTSFWRPAYHADVARALVPARLEFGGTARPGSSMPELHLTPAQRAAINAAPGGIARETLLDSFLARRFRSDIFIRGRRPGGRALLGATTLVLTSPPGKIKVQIPTQSGLAELEPAQEAALVGALAEGPKTVAELAALPACADLNHLDIALMLVESQVAEPLWRAPRHDPSANARLARVCDSLLRHFASEAAAMRSPLGVPVAALGSALPVSASELALCGALLSGLPPDPAVLSVHLARPQGDEEARARAEAGIVDVLAALLPPWRGMGVLP